MNFVLMSAWVNLQLESTAICTAVADIQLMQGVEDVTFSKFKTQLLQL